MAGKLMQQSASRIELCFYSTTHVHPQLCLSCFNIYFYSEITFADYSSSGSFNSFFFFKFIANSFSFYNSSVAIEKLESKVEFDFVFNSRFLLVTRVQTMRLSA